MRILVVCQHFYPEEFRINDICFELVKKGHNVRVLTGLPNYPKGKVLKAYKYFKKRKEIINGVEIYRSTLIGRGSNIIMMSLNYISFAIFASLKAIFMKKDFDIIYVYQLSPITMAWPAIVLKVLTKKKLVIHCLDQWPISITIGGIKKTSLIYRFISIISKWTYKKTDLITISSKSFENYFVNELGLKDKKIIYWPSYAESDYDNIKYKKNNDFDLVFAGNIGPAQSVETIVEAANILQKNKHIKFHIIGDGLNKKDCENLAKKYKLANIIFYGNHPVEKMPEFCAIADAYLITMVDNEVVNKTLPAKLQSYMLSGKPIIGSINGEVKEVINEANCGVCCNSMDYQELAKIILFASKEENKLLEWSINSKKYYENNFDKDKCIDSLINQLGKLTSQKIENTEA